MRKKRLPGFNSVTSIYLKRVFVVSIALIFVFVLVSVLIPEKEEETKVQEEFEFEKELKSSLTQENKTGEIDYIRVFNDQSNKIEKKELESYLVGVVAAEMPPQFDMEALKAQAVTARSYTVANLSEFGGNGCNRNPEADICTDPDHCQDYITKEEALNIWGENGESLWKKVERSVAKTRGEVISYDARPVAETFYHSTCGGKTESAVKVWGNDIPYIESVECEYCQHSQKYFEEEGFNWNELIDKITPYMDNFVETVESGKSPFKIISRSSTGRVLEARIAGKRFSGRDIREIFDLNSTNFELENTGQKWTFHTSGFGHGVGLCQYGADGKAREGHNYLEILHYYFNDIEVMEIY